VVTGAGNFTVASATCPAGTRLTGGGFINNTWNISYSCFLYENGPASPTVWSTKFAATNGTGCNGGTFHVRAICCP
jgi:hypothetical protein